MEPQKKGFLGRYKFTLVSLFLLIIIAVPLLLLANTANKKQMQQSPTSASLAPSTPLTQSNADATMQQADTSMQQTISQTDIDLQSVSQIDGSQDTTTGF